MSQQILTWKQRWGFCFFLWRLFWPDRPTPVPAENTTLTPHHMSTTKLKPHLEVHWRGGIFWFYPYDTWLNFWRRTEIILPNLMTRERIVFTVSWARKANVNHSGRRRHRLRRDWKRLKFQFMLPCWSYSDPCERLHSCVCPPSSPLFVYFLPLVCDFHSLLQFETGL